MTEGLISFKELLRRRACPQDPGVVSPPRKGKGTDEAQALIAVIDTCLRNRMLVGAASYGSAERL